MPTPAKTKTVPKKYNDLPLEKRGEMEIFYLIFPNGCYHEMEYIEDPHPLNHGYYKCQLCGQIEDKPKLDTNPDFMNKTGLNLIINWVITQKWAKDFKNKHSLADLFDPHSLRKSFYLYCNKRGMFKKVREHIKKRHGYA